MHTRTHNTAQHNSASTLTLTLTLTLTHRTGQVARRVLDNDLAGGARGGLDRGGPVEVRVVPASGVGVRFRCKV